MCFSFIITLIAYFDVTSFKSSLVYLHCCKNLNNLNATRTADNSVFSVYTNFQKFVEREVQLNLMNFKSTLDSKFHFILLSFDSSMKI